MRAPLPAVTWLCALLLPLPASATCSALWADYSGEGNSRELSLDRHWSLAELRSQRPTRVDWVRNPDPDAGSSHLANLHWVEQRAVEAQQVDGSSLRIHWIRYSSFQALLAWGRDDSALCPVLIIDGDVSIVDDVLSPEPIAQEGRTLFNVRVMVSGNGRLQESLFVGELDGLLVNVERQSFLPFVDAEGIRLHHRGGGFCASSLTWQNAAWKSELRDEPALWRVVYRWEGRALRVESTELVDPDAATELGCTSG